jgi:hypothetical protein
VQRQNAQFRRQACGLGEPVRYDTRRADHEARPVDAALALFNEEVGQGLDGLAEPHIVGEDTAKLVGAQELQPVEPVALIGSQLCL